MPDRFYKSNLKQGWVEVIAGCMFSGKTEELIRQIRRAELAKLSFQVFKPEIDNRYSETAVASHNQNTFPSTLVNSAADIYQKLKPNVDVIGIDEAQFFDAEIVDVVNKLSDNGKRVFVAGLDTDWKGRPFGPMPQLMAIAEELHKLHAICLVCGAPATRTQRLIPASEEILVGSSEMYEARCRTHFDPDLSLRLAKTKSKTKSSEAQLQL